MRIRQYKDLLFLVLFFFVGFVLGIYTTSLKPSFVSKVGILKTANLNGFKNYSTDFSLFWRVYKILQERYVDPSKLDDEGMYYGAIKGLVSALKDPATVFLDPQEKEEYEKSLRGEYEGIGAVLEQVGPQIQVVGVFEGAPAQKAGLQAGDIILEVDGDPVTGKSLVEVVTQIRGPKGTEVTLKVVRPTNGNEVKSITIVRDVIEAPSMRIERPEEGIILLRISRFTSETLQDWLLELSTTMSKINSEIANKKAKALIIDLRGNPGGYLEGAIEFVSYFLPKDTVVVYKESREGIDAVFRTRDQGSLKIPENIPVVVLVDSFSASASEIVAGALQHYKRAYIIGETTFGKGTVQDAILLEDGSLLKYTVSYWLLPNKKRLSKDHPVVPDKEVRFDRNLKLTKGIDNQLQAAIEYLRSKIHN